MKTQPDRAFTLRELEGTFLRITSPTIRKTGVTFARAQGVRFLCPLCFEANGGNVGTHGVICWFTDRGVPADEPPLPGRWTPSGTSLDDLTFVGPAAASILLQDPKGCGWHGFVKDGKVQ